MRNESVSGASTAVGNKFPLKKGSAYAGAMLGALGIVFGDIGTSPLYALYAVFGPHGFGLAITRSNVLGIVSMILWSVLLVVSVKYVGFIMRAGNKGEGGIMALVTLLKHETGPLKRRWLFIVLGMAGIALFLADSSITPAISVLSAVEGLQVISPSLSRLIIPATIVLLITLFWIQRYGTGFIGKIFGPIMLLWFVTIGLAGAIKVWQLPDILHAVSPYAAWHFIAGQPFIAFLSLGAVVLAVTGAEALYADMGHFGRPAISRAWFGVVFPALILCYLGQGAAILARPDSIASPYMALFSPALHVPALLLVTAATMIASQAVISGAFSLTRQAIHLDFLPRMLVRHTSIRESGQIYVPFINGLLCITVIALVISFGSSAKLAGLYGIAVSGTLAIDSILFLAVAHTVWRKSGWYVTILTVLFLTIDILFISANLPKIIRGGWLPICLAVATFIVVRTWYQGQQVVKKERKDMEGSLQEFVTRCARRTPRLHRAPGCAIYIGHHAGLAPLALHAAVEKLHELHEKVVIVSVRITGDAHIPEHKRAVFNNLHYNDGISELQLSFGYHDSPNIPRTLQQLRYLSTELDFDTSKASYFISLSKVVSSRRRNMAPWRKALYATLQRNALSTSDYYRLPADRTIEMRTLIEL